MSAKILVTSALPYANGPLHLGHLVEHIQTDIWVRTQKMLGRDCIALCGADAHGTPIMLKAEQLGITPEQLVNKYQAEHMQDFGDFHINYDHYYTTHSLENRELSASIYQRLLANGDISKRTIEQAYDPEKQLFLPDRYVRGECPVCHAKDQYGDSCEHCGSTYNPTDLINPKSILSGTSPIQKTSEHFFFNLPNYADFLRQWIQNLQPEIRHKLEEWLNAGLKDWDISRDKPYFGFEIPGEPGKYFYVWLDAPIGYMASCKHFCATNPHYDFDEFWQADSPHELYHFIGKDIIYFHALFWPAVLKSAGWRTPTAVFAHGFLTVDGHKMSKSRGTFIQARHYLNHLNPEYLRYYFAAKLSAHIEDIDLNFSDFMQRVNTDLVGKTINIASRCASFINKHFEGQLADECIDTELYNQFVAAGQTIADHYLARNYSKAMRDIMHLADQVNQYIDGHKPWVLIKQPEQHTTVQQVCSLGLNLFRLLMTYLQPVLPNTAQQAAHFLNLTDLNWNDRMQPLTAHKVNPFKPLMQRIEQEKITAMQVEVNVPTTTSPAPTHKEQITIDDFNKVDLRIAKIITAEHVDGADKLIKLSVDLGDGKPRQLFAGIKAAYEPADLVGRLTVVVANLKPRKMRFGLSEGMVLAVNGGDNKSLWLLSPDSGAKPGMPVK